MKEKGNSRNIVFVLLFIFIVYCPLLLIATDHFSSAVALNGDLSLYAENILKFQYGVVYQDITYALSHTTYGYGDFFFLILCILCFPFMMMGNETVVLVILRGISLLCLLGSAYLMVKIDRMLIQEETEKYSSGQMFVFCGVLSILPASTLLLTRIHPEIFQMLLFVSALYFVLKYLLLEKRKDLFFCALCSGLMVGCKISGVIFFLPLLVLLWAGRRKGFDLVCFGVCACPTALVSSVPLLLVHPIKALEAFTAELDFFTGTLQTYSISEFDYYEKLDTRADVLYAWITHAFSHGYVHPFVILLLLGACIYGVHNEVKNKSRIKMNTAILAMFVVNFLYYALTVTRVSTYYLYLPVVMLLFVFFRNIHKKSTQKWLFMEAIGIPAALLPSFSHFLDLYKESMRASIRLQTQRYHDLADSILQDDYLKKDTILLPTSINLDVPLEDLHWIPEWKEIHSDEPVIRRGDSVISGLKYYWTLEDYWNNHDGLDQVDLLVVDKKEERDYLSFSDSILDAGEGISTVYEDEYVVVYGTKLYADRYEGELCNLAYFTSSSIGWNRIGENCVQQPVNLEQAETFTLSFDWMNDKVENIRIVCKSLDYVWDFEMDGIKKGHNVVEIPKNQFHIQQGKMRWGYIDVIEVGGEFTDHVTLRNVKMEVQ